MDQKRISDLTELAQQLQSTDYVPLLHNSVTYKYAPFNYFVKNSGNETISGVKTFNSSPIIPAGDSASEAVNYGQVVKNSGDETITGVKTFSSTPIMTIQGGTASAVKDIIQTRSDTAANWTSVNPVLHQGEEGLETDTGRRKNGDGVTAWNSLGYSSYPSGYGTYNPSVADAENIFAITITNVNYSYHDGVCEVYGRMTIDIATTNITTGFTITTPRPYNFSASSQAAGNAMGDITGNSFNIYANASTQTVRFQSVGGLPSANAQGMNFHFIYKTM